jgi:hypothetical protein
MADTNVKQQIIDKLKDSSNVLVTVNTNPSVDELSAALGLTLFINKLNKHATAIFSGDVPPAIEFLNPEKTFENTVDSLRDFIIALDKEKADHLRYKVVDDMVKIFITPYRTTISQDDLDFSQGDYNVELVIAIGVQSEADLDRALESHGRILHDATVAAVSIDTSTNLGGLEWVDANVSSYSEMLLSLVQSIKSDKKMLDEQIATAFLTGIVAATDRFSNNRTSSDVMTVAAQLMAAGANQQLIATQLEENQTISAAPERSEAKSEPAAEKKPADEQAEAGPDGSLSISHMPKGDVDEVAEQVATDKSEQAAQRAEELVKESDEKAEDQLASHLAGVSVPVAPLSEQELAQSEAPKPSVLGPLPDAVHSRSDEEAGEPSMGGTLNATAEQAEEDKRRQIEDDRNRTILTHGGSYTASAPSFQAPMNASLGQDTEPEVKDIFDEPAIPAITEHVAAIQPPAPAHVPTLAEIDAENRSKHDEARDAVSAALETSGVQPGPGARPFEPLPASPAPTLEPDLPPLPPMPDFSTLPPLPSSNAPAAPFGTAAPEQQSSPFGGAPVEQPPAAPAPVISPSDPGQFKIPGQS